MSNFRRRPSYDPFNWYWLVDDRIYSSANAAYVPQTDSTYSEWLKEHTPTRIASEDELADVLRAVNPDAMPLCLKKLEYMTQKALDAGAQACGYDSIVTACSYAGYPNEYQTEGLSFAQWRSACWAYCYDAQVSTEAEFVTGMPGRS